MTKKFYHKSVWVWIILISFLIFSVLIASIPRIGEWMAERWLREHGAVNAEIEDIDFNVFTGRLRLYGLHAGSHEGSRFEILKLDIDFKWLPIMKRRVELGQISLTGANMDLYIQKREEVKIGAVIIPLNVFSRTDPQETNQTKGAEWGFGINHIELRESRVRYHIQNVESELVIRNVNIGNFATWEEGSVTPIEANVILDGSNVSIITDVKPFAGTRHIRGMIKLTDLDLAHYQMLLRKSGVKRIQGTLTIDMKTNIIMESNGQNTIAMEGTISGSNIEAELENIAFKQNDVRWQGKVTLTIPAGDSEDTVDVNGELGLKKTDVKLGDLDILISQDLFSWNGRARFLMHRSQEKTALDIHMHASSHINNLHIQDLQRNVSLGIFDTIKCEEIEVAGIRAITLKQLQLENIRAIERIHEFNRFLSLDHVTAHSVAFKNLTDLTIGKVQLSNLGIDFGREKDGTLKWLNELFTQEHKPDSTAQSMVAENNKPQKQMTFAIDHIDIRGDSWLKFTDKTVEPPYEAVLRPVSMTINNINSAESQQLSSLDLKATLGEYTSFIISGSILPFEKKMTADLAINIDSFDIYQISSYVPGYDIKRGSLNADMSVKITKGTLNIQNNLLISKLKFVTKSNSEQRLLGEGLSMPLDIALDLLRDRNDQIRLKIPVQGDMEQPEFNLQHVINKAVINTIKNGALLYVKHALQPLGAIMLVGKIAGKAAKPRFNPLSFLPGESNVSDEGKEYLDKIATLLVERPRLALTFCGVAVVQDKNELLDRAMKDAQMNEHKKSGQQTPSYPQPVITNEMLLELAKSRGASMKNYLVSQKNIPPERLFSCKSIISHDENAIPRVEIML